MPHPARELLTALCTPVLLCAAALALAQTAAPARETPRPQDIDPAVNTSAPASSQTAAPVGAAPAPSAETSAPGTPTAAGTPPPPRAGAAGEAKPKGRAQDHIELDPTQITGNRELPKVLYIVPWKRSDLGDLVGKPVNSLLDEVLAPVDRDVFRRENRYYRALATDSGQPAGGNAAPDAGAAPNGAARAGATSNGDTAPPARDEPARDEPARDEPTRDER